MSANMHLTKLQVVLAEVAMLHIQSNYLQEARPSKYYSVLQSTTTQYYSVPQSTTQYYSVLHSATPYYKVLHSTAQYYSVPGSAGSAGSRALRAHAGSRGPPPQGPYRRGPAGPDHWRTQPTATTAHLTAGSPETKIPVANSKPVPESEVTRLSRGPESSGVSGTSSSSSDCGIPTARQREYPIQRLGSKCEPQSCSAAQCR